MSSDTNILIFQPDRTRILNRILANAKYATENMRPLSGPLRERSKIVLKHFRAGVILDTAPHLLHRPNHMQLSQSEGSKTIVIEPITLIDLTTKLKNSYRKRYHVKRNYAQ